ncbi:MAG TPA: hypothetical protein ENN42_00370 [Thioalkalivibrio sp.]|nr:hypothetical protein [Thioalkalivibrio sp.]
MGLIGYVHIDDRWREMTDADRLDGETLFWLDFTHHEDDWPSVFQRLGGGAVHERHVKDSLNLAHPPYYDATSDYEMLIFRPLAGLQSNDLDLDTSASTLLLFAHGLVTIRPPDNGLFEDVGRRLHSQTPRQPETIVGVAHALLHRIVEEQMRVRGPLAMQLELWQQRLFGSEHGVKDWVPLLDLRGRLRRFSTILAEQLSSLTLWRSETELHISEHVGVRMNDVMEHIKRTAHDIDALQHDIEGMIQIYFSITGQRTNSIVQLLTIISVVFLPLNLIAGIFGMNFEQMPLLDHALGFWATAIGMAALGLATLLLLRLKRWI